MKEILLPCGRKTQVDDEDFEKFSSFVLCSVKDDNTFYVQGYKYQKGIHSKNGRKSKKLHRLILGIDDPNILVDHIDHNGLNNQKYNLRPCSRSDNNRNIRHPLGKVPYFGVEERRPGKYRAYIYINRISKHLGYFDTAEKAALAYNKAAIETGNPFYVINNITEP